MAENLPIKHSLSEAIHNSSISKIDIQSQHPTYPLEDIDQEKLFEIRKPNSKSTITSSKTDQFQTKPDQSQITLVPKQIVSLANKTRLVLDPITSKLDLSYPVPNQSRTRPNNFGSK